MARQRLVSANSMERAIGIQIEGGIECGRQASVTHLRAKEIVWAATEAGMFGPDFPEIDVDWVCSPKIVRTGRYVRTVWGWAERSKGWITIFEGGRTIGTLLHEMAHMMPGSRDHEKSWQDNFRKMVDWFNTYRRIQKAA